MTKSGSKNGRVAPEKSATHENGGMTKENVKGIKGIRFFEYIFTNYAP